jgi:hypothetical protein
MLGFFYVQKDLKIHYRELLLLLKPFHELETNLEKLETLLRDAYLLKK